MFELGTGTGFSETVVWVLVGAVVVGAMVVAAMVSVPARGEVLSDEADEPLLAAAGDARARASRTAAVRLDERTRRG
jgi:hypothetical protein